MTTTALRGAPPGAANAVPRLGRISAGVTATRLILNGVEGFGKCLGRGTPILMFDGTTKPVEAVLEGDILMGPDSKPRRATGIHSGFGPLYRVTPTKGDSYVVNGKHVLSLKLSRRLNGGGHKVVNVTVRCYLAASACFRRDALGWRTGVEWPEKDLPLDPYLLGCWLGDGTADKPQITTPEPEVVGAMASFASGHAGVSVKAGAAAGRATSFNITGERTGGTVANPFTERLRSLGVFQNKHIPLVYKTAAKSQRLQLLAGLLDTDGHQFKSCFEITQKNQRLADDILFLARSVGLAAYGIAEERVCTNSPTRAVGTYVRIKISGHTSKIPTRVPRKRAEPRRQIKDVLVTGIRVDPIGDGEFFGFEVDGDHLFLMGDFTVTHNTTFGAHAPKPAILMARGETGFATLRKAERVPDADAVELSSWNSTLRVIDSLAGSEYRSVVLDALGGFERLCHEHVCARDFNNEWGEKGFQAYMRGYDIAVADWLQLLHRLDRLHADGMNVVLLSHVKPKTFKNPLGPDFDRYMADCHEKTWGVTHKWADAVLFGTFVTVTQEKKGRTKGIGGTDRVIYTERTDGYDAKNRYGMPVQIDLPDQPSAMWGSVWSHVVGSARPAAEPVPEL